MAYIIGISGGSGSGKTSFVRKLANQFGNDQVCLISQDDYYKPKSEQKKDKNGIINFDLPGAMYLDDFVEDLKKLEAGESVERVEYTFNNEKQTAKKLVFTPAPIILVEGLYIFHYKKIRKRLNLSVLIQAKASDKIIRRILRDQKERNYPIDDVLYRYKHHVIPSYEKHIAPYIDKIDLVINNNKSFDSGLEVLAAFIRQKLLNKV